MMRVRRASAAVALCLLASAMTACAQCGWVLWEISSPTPKHPDPILPAMTCKSGSPGAMSYDHRALRKLMEVT